MRTFSILLGSILSIAGCAGQSSAENVDERGDASIRVDAANRDTSISQRDMGLDFEDAGSEEDSGADDWIETANTSAWTRFRPCTNEEQTVQGVGEGALDVPDFPDPDIPIDANQEDIEQVFGSPLPRLFGLYAPPSYEPGNLLVYDLFPSPGDQVRLTLHTTNPLEESTPDTPYRVTYTVLLDNEPVAALFQRYDSERSSVIEEVGGSGLSFEPTERLSIVDVFVPAEAFRLGHMHELSIAVFAGRVDGDHFTETRRVPIFYGGYEPSRSQLPCASAPLRSPSSDFEREVLKKQGFNVAVLFTNPAEQTRSIRRVEPTDSIRVFYSIRPRGDSGPHTVAITPILNGQPIGATQWAQHGGPGQATNGATVDVRGFFDVTFPTEPGFYLVGLSVVEDPFVRWREFGTLEPRRGFPTVYNAEVRGSAAPLWFEVRE